MSETDEQAIIIGIIQMIVNILSFSEAGICVGDDGMASVIDI